MKATSPIVVAGNVNLETRVAVEAFPLEYVKTRYAFNGVSDQLGGVAWNVAHALLRNGMAVRLAALVGRDEAGTWIAGRLAEIGIDSASVIPAASATARSVVLQDRAGRGAIFTDLKNLQDVAYPSDRVAEALRGACHLHATNLNWTLALAAAATQRHLTISTDVHAIASLDDAYNLRYLEIADVIFLSAEKLESTPERAVGEMLGRFPADVVVCGCGAEGAVLGVKKTGAVSRHPAVRIERTAMTTGAGDALAGSFLAGWLQGLPPEDALDAAQRYVAQVI